MTDVLSVFMSSLGECPRSGVEVWSALLNASGVPEATVQDAGPQLESGEALTYWLLSIGRIPDDAPLLTGQLEEQPELPLVQ